MSGAITEQGLALMLEASRDFAFAQMARGERLVPFAAYVPEGGEIEFIRIEGENTRNALAEVHRRTRAVMAERVRAGGLSAVALVAVISADESNLGSGFSTAVSVELQAPGFARVVLVPFRVDRDITGKGTLVTGQMIPLPAEGMLYPA
ncbi:MAG: hypothetical protein N2Z59_08125 [Alteraurantiacibacter sp.]|nr:hypothetical protein [Alteraurantiacibacter sp.]